MRRLLVLWAFWPMLIVPLAPESLFADPAPPPSHKTVCNFGAVGDGQADDTSAIQNAVDAGRGDIRFPRGVYRITRPIVVELDRVGPTSFVADGTARLVMAGPGPAIKLIGTHSGTAAPRTVKPEVWERQRTPMVDGLEIVGEHPDAVGIEADGTMQLVISRVSVRDCLHGIHLVGRNRNVLVADCHLYKNLGAGLYLDDVNLHQINVTGSHISYNAAGGVVSRAGNVRNLHITGCDIESNMSPETPPTANVLIDCTGGAAGTAEIAITGCTIQHNHQSPDSANIRFLGASKPEYRWGHLTIANNVLSDVQINVDIQQARGVSIVGNTFGTGCQHDLRIVGSSNVVIGPNVLDRNPHYKDEDFANGGVVLEDCQDMTISGLHITQVRRAPAGLVLKKCRRVNVTGSTILDCDNAGILLEEVSLSRLSGNLIHHDQAGEQSWTAIKTEGGGGNTISSQ